MASLDLTTVARVKDWLSISGSTSDTVIARAITRISADVMGYLERGSFLNQEYREYFDGQNSSFQFTERWPVNSVIAVVVDNRTIQPANIVSPDGSTNANSIGWRIETYDGIPPGEPQAIELIGYTYCRGRQNCLFQYTAGYLELADVQVVASGLAAASMPYGVWLADAGVTYVSTGAALVKVATAPAVGQYALNPAVLGGYIFNAADDAASVNLSYSYCPYTVEGVVWDMVSDALARRSRPSQASRSLAGQETASYVPSDIPRYAVRVLQPYKSVIPL